MKIIILILISFSVSASNWVPISKIQDKSPAGYQMENDCRKTGEQCLDVGDEPEIVKLGLFSLEDVMGNDGDKPIWGSRSLISPCSGEEDCKAKALAKSCIDGREPYYNAEYSEVWCNKITGYQQKVVGKSISIKQAELAAYKAQLQAQAQAETLINMGAKADQDCKRVLHLIGGLNLLPGRTQDQIDTMSASLEPIKQALQDGRPGKAKSMIMAIEPDGKLVTQQMKDLALSQLKDW